MSARSASVGALSARERSALEEVKLVALSQGLRIEDRVLEALGGPGRLTIHEYATTGGITLALAGEVLVNAPFDEPFCAASPLLLARDGDGLCLRLGDARVAVER
ncbi:MAG TPA: hypothetical protein VFU94_07880, partial [Conexibacter sp.]|nr:hypothetical protein [Conexibacter sp.]